MLCAKNALQEDQNTLKVVCVWTTLCSRFPKEVYSRAKLDYIVLQ